MSWNPLDWISAGSDLVTDIGDAIDKNVTSDEERLTLKNELVKLKTAYEVRIAEINQAYEEEVTKRWVSDNEGSSMARNVRPYSLAGSLIFTALLIVVDSYSTQFTVNQSYIELLGTLLFIMVPSYFGMREIGKGIKAWRSK